MAEVLTERDEANAKLIALLLFVNKVMTQARRAVAAGENGEGMAGETWAKSVGKLFVAANSMFPKEGQMEAATIALSKELGLEVEQQYMTQGSQVKQ